MKRVLFLLLISAFVLFLFGCSNKEQKQLTYDEIKDLPISEQVDSIIKNTKLVDEFEIVIDDKSVAVIYAPIKVPDSTLVLSDKKESFPNVAMTFVENLSILDLDEIVITSYEPKDTEGITGLTRVSATFSKETTKDLDFEKWKEEKKNHPSKFYRYADAYLIRGNVWDKLNDDIRDRVGNESKKTDSEFWDYYGSYVE